MGKQTLLQLAFPSNGNENIAGHLASLKIDGMRAFWDGGITRGLPKEQVPWANTTKDARFIEAQVSTGLWSRYGHVIYAPDWFLDLLPVAIMLDGELGMGRGLFQQTVSTVKSHDPNDPRWKKVVYRIFDLLTPQIVLQNRVISDEPRNYFVSLWGADKWAIERGAKVFHGLIAETEYARLCEMYPVTSGWGDLQLRVAVLEQIKLPQSLLGAWAEANKMMEAEVKLGGEGIIIRHPAATYETERSHYLIKGKPYSDMDGEVIGWKAGEIGKGMKLYGSMGSLILRIANGKTVNCPGFDDAERALTPEQRQQAYSSPGGDFYTGTPVFPLGTVVTFKYRELTVAGVPKELRYYRKRD